MPHYPFNKKHVGILESAAGHFAERSYAVMGFEIVGKPVPAGSKRAFPIRRKDGTIGVAVSDTSAERLKSWSQLIRDAALRGSDNMLIYKDHAFRARSTASLPHRGPVLLAIQFYMCRPKTHYRAQFIGLKHNAPLVPTVRPDLTKLVRAIEDALTGVLWADDSQIVLQTVSKSYTDAPSAQWKTEVEVILCDV